MNLLISNGADPRARNEVGSDHYHLNTLFSHSPFSPQYGKTALDFARAFERPVCYMRLCFEEMLLSISLHLGSSSSIRSSVGSKEEQSHHLKMDRRWQLPDHLTLYPIKTHKHLMTTSCITSSWAAKGVCNSGTIENDILVLFAKHFDDFRTSDIT